MRTILFLTALLVSFTASAESEVIYNSQAFGPSIYSYQDGEKSSKPETVYNSLVAGPAMYSYETAVSPVTVPFTVEYTNTAYGPAIHSYK
jgi:hypothetical protein